MMMMMNMITIIIIIIIDIIIIIVVVTIIIFFKWAKTSQMSCLWKTLQERTCPQWPHEAPRWIRE